MMIPAARRPNTRRLRFPEVQARVGLSRTTIDRLEREGLFPRREHLTPRTVSWREDEIERWLSRRTAEDGR